MKHLRHHAPWNRSARNRLPMAAQAVVEMMERRVLLSATGSISGTMYNDVNGDHGHQSYEPVLAGWGVYLDKNNNGKLDTGDVRVFSDSKGNYTFPNLAAGTYYVRQNTPTGWLHTNVTPFPFVVKLAAGQKVTTGVNILNQQLGAVTLVSNGTLYVTGTESADTISVTLNDVTTSRPGPPTGSVDVTINGSSSSTVASKVKNIKVNALAGDDTITETDSGEADIGSAALQSTLSGGDGNDTITDSVFWTPTMPGTFAGDSLDGGAGNDYLHDQELGVVATLNGGSGNDTLFNNAEGGGGGGSSVEYGGPGNDIFQWYEDSSITCYGGGGTDTLDTTPAALSGPFNADLRPGGGAHFFDGGFSFPKGDINTLLVAPGIGWSTVDITANNAGDNITVQAAVDGITVTGGSGNDYISASNAPSISLAGGAGNDTLKATSGNDVTLSGGDGNDLLSTDNSGKVALSGGAGTDAVDYSNRTGNLKVYLDGSKASTDSAHPSESDTFDGTVERVYGGSGNDLIVGNNSDDALFGNGGNDTLVAGTGQTALWGGDGNDLLIANNGTADYVNGGAGDDTAYVNKSDTVVDVEHIHIGAPPPMVLPG